MDVPEPDFSKKFSLKLKHKKHRQEVIEKLSEWCDHNSFRYAYISGSKTGRDLLIIEPPQTEKEGIFKGFSRFNLEVVVHDDSVEFDFLIHLKERQDLDKQIKQCDKFSKETMSKLKAALKSLISG